MQIEGTDKLDNAILALIKDRARMSYSDIGAHVGLSRVAVKNRMQAMEEKGIIRGYRTEINETAGPSGITFFLDLEVETGAYEDVVEQLAFSKEILQIYSVAGNARIHAKGFAPNAKQMEHFSRELYRSAKSIRRLECIPVLSTIKDENGGVEYVRYQEPEDLEGRTPDG